MVQKAVEVRLSGPKGSLRVRMVLDPGDQDTRIPRSIAKEIGATRKGVVELNGGSYSVSLKTVPNGEGNCPSLGLAAMESLGLVKPSRTKVK